MLGMLGMLSLSLSLTFVFKWTVGMSQWALQSVYTLTLELEHLVFVSLFAFVCAFVIVIFMAEGLWIVCVISFQKIFG